jgi:hypothetical protein
MALSQILFYSIVSVSVGGRDESYGIRYFLEAVPLLTILTVTSIRRWIDEISVSQLALFALVFTASSLLLYSKPDLIYPKNKDYRIIPTILSIGLLASYIKNFNRKEASKLFTILMALAVAFSAVVAYYDTSHINAKKPQVSRLWHAVEGAITGDSVIVVPEKALMVHILKPKLDIPSIRYVLPETNGYQDTLEILSFYQQRNKTIYLFNPNKMVHPSWKGNITDIYEKMKYDKMHWMNVTRIR